MFRTYSELRRLKTFNARYEYLRLYGQVGQSTFGYDRYLNQLLYKSKRWKKSRDEVIIRDHGCDLGIMDYEIHDLIIVHHMNVLTLDDIEEDRDEIYDPEFLISTSSTTHNALHYSNDKLLQQLPMTRKRNDTCPWK